MNQICVGILESHVLVRSLLCQALLCQTEFTLGFACATESELPAVMPTVLLMGAHDPHHLFGENLMLDYWRIRCPDSQLVLLSDCQLPHVIYKLMGEGLMGYAIRHLTEVGEVMELLQSAARSQPAVCTATLELLGQMVPHQVHLTPRELQLVRTIQIMGLYNRRAVAHELGVSVNTLGVHLFNLCNKLEVESPMLVSRCQALGLIE